MASDCPSSFFILVHRRSHRKGVGYQGHVKRILLLEDDWANNVATFMLESWDQKEQVIQNI